MPAPVMHRTATLLVAGIVGLLVVVAFAVALATSQQNGRQTVEERFADGSHAAAALVSTIVSQAYSSDADLGRRLLSGRRVTTAALRRASTPGQPRPMIVLDARGRRLAAYPAAAARAPITGQHIRWALAGSPAISGALPAPGGPAIEVAVPFDTPYGRRVLVLPTYVRGVQRILAPYLANLPGLAGHRAYLVDRHGRILADSRPKAPRDAALAHALSPVAPRVANEPYAGGHRQLSSAPVARTPWTVVDTATTSVLYSPVSGWPRTLPWIALVALIAALAFILLLAQRAGRAAAQARQASEAKSAFLASMSHELRTPMTTVIGFSEMLQEGKLGALSERQHEVVGHIVASSRHLNQLVSEILDLSRVEEGRMTFDPKEVHPHALVAEVVDGMRGLADDRGITVDVDAPDLGTRRLDAARFKQVVYNLLGNAIKFTEAGGHVAVRLAVAADGGLELAVSDDGPGIRADEVERIFLPFEQGARRNGGAGLGLAVSRRIADAQGGAITVQSVPGQGATFTLTLPERG